MGQHVLYRARIERFDLPVRQTKHWQDKNTYESLMMGAYLSSKASIAPFDESCSASVDNGGDGVKGV